MTRLVTCGWETGNSDENQTSQSASADWAAATTSPAPKSPSVYCLRSAASAASKSWTLPAAKTDLYIRFRVYLPASATVSITNFIVLYDSAAGLQVHVDWSVADNLLRVYRAAGATNLLGTSSLTLPLTSWHLVELRWQASSATSGIVQLWLDGTLTINLSGVDNTATANVNVQRFDLNTSGSAGTGFGFDDLAINDTAGTLNNGQIGEGSIVLLKPNGAGTNTAQTRGGTDSGANWSQVDELPVSLTDYVFSATAGTRDTYALEDIPAGSWSVNCAEVVAYAQNSDIGAGSLGPTVKSGATTNEGTAQALGTTATFVRQLYETDPNTSVAWTNAAVNALEAGTTVR
jgi:hypothetical protein